MSDDAIYTVYGAFAPSPSTFTDEARAIEYAKASVNDWAKDVVVVKSQTIWRSAPEPTTTQGPKDHD